MTGILSRSLKVANVGAELFADELERQGIHVKRIDWRPPTDASASLQRLAIVALRTAEANHKALAHMQEARPRLSGIRVARDVIDGMSDRTFLHAGPPIEWGDMSGPLRGAICGAAVYEELASHPEQAERMARSGEFEFVPCHERGAVGPMAGVVSASMPMWIVANSAGGNRAFCTLNEGLGEVLRYGANGREVIEHLRWMRDVLARVLESALRRAAEAMDIRALIAQALQMGDEGHNRNRAGTTLFLRDLLPALVEIDEPSTDVVAAVRFMSSNDHFFLNLVMPAAKVTADSAVGIEDSSIIVAMARNGTEFGVRVSGTHDAWFTGSATVPDGLYLPGFGAEDANRDIGDSTITETVGLGGFAMAAAPAIVSFVGGSPEDARRATELMYSITWSESDHYQVPTLGFRGTPLGIDAREVVHTGVLPVINTGIAHREPGVGQVGAGIVKPPIEAFIKATKALAEST